MDTEKERRDYYLLRRAIELNPNDPPPPDDQPPPPPATMTINLHMHFYGDVGVGAVTAAKAAIKTAVQEIHAGHAGHKPSSETSHPVLTSVKNT